MRACDCWMCGNPRFRTVHAASSPIFVQEDAARVSPWLN